MEIFYVGICNAGYGKFKNNLSNQDKYRTINKLANNKMQKV